MGIRYWMYKNNRSGGPAGYRGDWDTDVFASAKEHQWGGSYSTESPEVLKRLDEDMSVGDVIVSYQTDDREVVGFCRVTKMTGPVGGRKIWLTPVERLDPPFRIHEYKRGTPLENAPAVNGPVMLRQLQRSEMHALVSLAGAPQRVLQGRPKAAGYRP